MFNPVEPHPDFPKLEEEILKFWEKEKIFEKSLAATKNGKPFTFYDGPPFATGLPHYGHILASTIKDVIPRYQTMRGRYVRRRWGWDCHGLPIEEIVERELKISGKKQIEAIGIKKFNETCRRQVLQYVAEWRKTVRRIARWVEFDDSYKTMDRDYMESVWWAFKQIYEKGLVYEGRKVLLYCPRCETPISNFEVAMDNSYQDVTEEAVTVKFRLKKDPVIARSQQATKQPQRDRRGADAPRDDARGDTYLLAWTTTPWTLAGNVALAVGKEIDYVLVESGGENYIIAKDRLPVILEGAKGLVGSRDSIAPLAAGLQNDTNGVIAEFKGRALVGIAYEPFYEVPEMQTPEAYHVYAADFVNTEEGTGIVHTAVVYGEDDYNLGVKVGLPVVPLLDEKGKFNDKAPELVRGQYFKDSEKSIKADLEQRGLLFNKEPHLHSYPHCWRCDTPLFYNAIPAWFINIQKIKAKLLSSNKKEINWFPEHLKLGRYAKSMEMAPDWNISRNRYWGNPIPVWKCEKCGQNTVIGSVAELREKAVNFSVIARSITTKQSQGEIATHPSGARNDEREGEFDLHRPYIDEVILKCEHCGGEARRITEIFDSWVEAASMPFASVHYPFTPTSSPPILQSKTGGEREGAFRFPAQFVAEYIAQTRAWFYVMHVVSYILFGHAPFENVVTTGTILAEDGSKMSKSKNNFPDPWKVIDQYGVDTLRFYLMNSVVMQADNLNFNIRDLESVNRKVIRILWNVYNYFVTYANANKYNPNATRDNSSLPPLKLRGGEGALLDQWIATRAQELVNEVTKYLDAYDTVRATRAVESFVNDLSTWYVRRSRGRQDFGFFSTLRETLLTLSRVIAPFMPYIAESICQNLRLTKSPLSVHLTVWPEAKKLTAKQDSILGTMKKIRALAEEAHAQRARAGIKLRQPLAASAIPDLDAYSPAYLQIYKDEVNVLEVKPGKPHLVDTQTFTPELRVAGLARELERQVNKFRKESGLKIGEVVDLAYETKSAIIKEAMEKVDRKKIYAKDLQLTTDNLPTDPGVEIEVNGETVRIAIINVKYQSSNAKSNPKKD